MTDLEQISVLEAELADAQTALAAAQIAVRMRDLHIESLDAQLRRLGRLVSDLRAEI